MLQIVACAYTRARALGALNAVAWVSEGILCGKALLNAPADCAAGMFKKQNDERDALQKQREAEGIY